MSVTLKNLDPRTAQQILASAGYYKGAITGDIDAETLRAVDRVAQNMTGKMDSWSRARQVIGAVQRILDVQGYAPGLVDGYAGHNTSEAVTAWLSDKFRVDSTVDRSKESPILSPGRLWSSTEQRRYPTQADVPSFYGQPGSSLATAGICKLPIPFPLAWDTASRVTQFRCHQKVAEPMSRVFAEAVKHYGEEQYRKLRLDLFGGCYNYRKMRGSTAVSMHAYGIAVDLDPERNQLRWDKTRASFARDEYIPFWNIVVSNGGTPAGYAWDGDWMHVQWARLK